MFPGRKKSSNKADDDSLDDILGDLLEPEDSPKKKQAQGRGRPVGRTGSGGRDDFYSNLAAMAENDGDSDMSDADVGKMAKAIAGLDDMDADLFGGNLQKKNGAPAKGGKGGSKPTTPRRGGGSTPRSSNTPRGADRVASPTRSGTPTSPPGSARSGSLKRKPVKPSSSSAGASVSMHPPGTAPGKMTDIGRASENLRPGQSNKEDQRPGTVPRVKKYDFGEFDEEDPLAGLSLDESDISEAKPAAKRGALTHHKAAEEAPKSSPAAPIQQPGSPRKPSLFDRPPTRSGSGTVVSEPPPETATPAKAAAEPVPKRKEEMVFSDDDNFLDGLGIDVDTKKAPAAGSGAATPAASAPAPNKSHSLLGDSDESKPAKSILDGLLGRGQKSASTLLETKEKPRTFVLDKKYTQQHKEEKKAEEDDFLFGNYQPSAAGSTPGASRPGSRRSVRFQDDDDIFGLDKPSGGRRGSSGTRSVPDDMKWLEELTGGAGESTPSSNRSAATTSVKTTAAETRLSTPSKSYSAEKPSDSISRPEPSRGAGAGVSTKDSLLDSLGQSGSKDPPVESKKRDPGPSSGSKLDSKDWLGLKDSDSDGELFIPKRVASRSPGVVDSTPHTPTSANSRQGRGGAKAGQQDAAAGKKSDDDDEDSFIARAKARRQAAMGNQSASNKDKGPAVSVGGGGGVSSTTVDPTAFLSQLESPRFEGSVPAVMTAGAEDSRDLFAMPPTRSATAGRLDTGSRRTSQVGLSSAADGESLMMADSHGRPVTADMGGDNSGQVFQSTHFAQRREDGRFDRFSAPAGSSMTSQQAQLQQQLDLQQRLQQHQQQQQLQHQQELLAGVTSGLTGGLAPQPQGMSAGVDVVSGSYLSTAVPQGPIPSSLQDALAQLRKLEIEKQYIESLLESTKKRYDEEISAIERSYKNRIQILEESNQKTEARLRMEAERLMEEHLGKVKRMEQEKAELAEENFRRLEDQQRTFAQDMEKLKEKQRQALQDLKKEHEEAEQLLLEAKNKEISKVASTHDTSRALSAAVEQIESNARDLGQLQIKLDDWNRAGLDEREIAFRSKDEQLKIMQERLVRQEGDNERERHRLEDLIARMESQNREQLRQLEEERWKVKQEQSRLEAQQTALETERRSWTEQHSRERQSLDRARDMFLEEQQSGLSHLTDERRSLAEERSKLNMEQKLHRERVQQDSVKLAQVKAEYDVLSKSIAEEKAQAAERMRELRREEDRMAVERDRFQDRTAALDQERQRLEKLALNIKQRSTELDAISEEASRAHESGERALSESRLLHSQLDLKRGEVEGLRASVKNMEEHLAQEKLRLAKEKKDLENLRQAGLCINCRNMLQAPAQHPMQKEVSGSLLAAGTPGVDFNPLAGSSYPSGLTPTPLPPTALPNNEVGISMSHVMCQSIASSIASDRAVRMWKIQAIKDKEYLEEESMFLEGLRHSPYHSKV